MRKKRNGEARGSTLAGGWVVEAETEVSAEADASAPASAGTSMTVPDASSEDSDSALDAPGQISNGALVLFGVFGGLYLLYTWVWVTWAQYYADVNAVTAAGSGSVGGILQQIVFWAVPFAPALWYITAFRLYRHRTGRLAVALLIGAIVLAPIPMFVSSGGAL